MDEKKKSQCNYEKVHVVYRTQQKPKPSTAASSSDELVL